MRLILIKSKTLKELKIIYLDKRTRAKINHGIYNYINLVYCATVPKK